MNWYSVAEEIFFELACGAYENTQNLTRPELISAAAKMLGKSDSMIRRYLTAYDMLTGLMADKTTDNPDILGGIPFAAAEYIGRIARHDEDRAYGHVLSIVHGSAGVVDVRDDYNAMMSLLKEGRTKVIEFADGRESMSRMSKAVFDRFVAEAIFPLMKLGDGEIARALSGFFPEFECLQTLERSDGSRGAVVGFYQMPPKMNFPLERRFASWAFAAQYFHQYWIMVHPLSDPEPEVEKIMALVAKHGIGSVGVAVSHEPYDYNIMRKPDPDWEPRPLPHR